VTNTAHQPDAVGPGVRAWPWVAGAVVFVVLSPVAAAAMRSANGSTYLVWAVVQAAATGLAFLIPQLRQVRAERQQASAEESEFEVRVDTVLRMNDALDPVVRLLGAIALEPDDVVREQLRAKAVPLVLLTAAELIGPERARACWFPLVEGPPRQLLPADSAGRSGAPTTTFTEHTVAGDAALDMVLSDQDRLCVDVDLDPPPGWDAERERDYRTFVAVPVVAADTAYGMVTLDALHPGDLDHDDVRLLRLMAGALAVALAVR
jgi:hypothetical protein